MLTFERERMSDEFEKWHIIGLPFGCALHHFTGVDRGDAHDHPFAFTSHILSGGYVEDIYNADGSCGAVERQPGTCHSVVAEHIHRIVELPQGQCWTLVLPGPHVRVTRFWRTCPETGAFVSRCWDEAWGD